MTSDNGLLKSDTSRDLLKIAVINRYQPGPPSLGIIKNFGLKHGAIASSVAHDSHNIIVVGADDNSMSSAANLVIQAKGGISVANGLEKLILPLPIAGLMSDQDGYQVANRYSQIDQMAKDLGSTLSSPFMTLSFMALLVIPALKISDKYLFDAQKFEKAHLFV